MIVIVPYKPSWRDEFMSIGIPLRSALGDMALRIDHIGSTSIPGLAAKDIIDIQISTLGLSQDIEEVLHQIGYSRVEHITHDHFPPGCDNSRNEWRKWVFKPHVIQRPTNVHVRISGRANQRYPLLFRDYLREHPLSAKAYERVKEALVKFQRQDKDFYYEVKDPVCDLIIAGAEQWAAVKRWKPGPSDC